MAINKFGDLQEMTFNHPTVGTFTVYFKAGESSSYDLGGFETNDDAQGIDGAGRMILQMNRKRWFAEGTATWDMNGIDEFKLLQDVKNSGEEASITMTWVNGVVLGGKGIPVGEFSNDVNAGTFTLKVSGGDVLKRIV